MKKTKALENDFYFGANAEMLRLAGEQRRNMTEAEKILWEELRGEKLGVKFRRQHAISTFIADFYCHEKQLVVEIDGSIHEIDSVKDHDEGRDYEMQSLGIRVLRFTNKEVFGNMSHILSVIKKEIE